MDVGFPDIIRIELIHVIFILSFNRGRPRYIPGQHGKNGIKIHRSVKLRMDEYYPWNTKKHSPRPEIRAEPFWEDLDLDDSHE